MNGDRGSPKNAADDSDDDIPRLSVETMAILHDFMQEKKSLDAQITDPTSQPQEDWELSQFWYSEETTEKLAKEVLHVIGDSGRVACLSCPTLYIRLMDLLEESGGSPPKVSLLEYDRRFNKFPGFRCYDYRQPLDISSDLEGAYDLVVVDPPFLSEECLSKMTQTVRCLARGEDTKIILCTGTVQKDLAHQYLGLRHFEHFHPRHTRNLGNEFACFVNYEPSYLDDRC